MDERWATATSPRTEAGTGNLINHEGLMKRYIPSRDERRRGVTRELGTTSVICR